MFSYILSFFRSPEPALSIEDAAKILTQESDLSEEHFTKVKEKGLNKQDISYKEEYNFSTKTGTITGKKDGNYVIDNLYEFEPDCQEFEIGTSVSYQKLISEGNFVIYNVNPINSDWDTVYERESMTSTRVMVCQVEKREKRILVLTPGEIKVDLDKVAIEFIPILGDWLQLDVKYEVNEHSLDLSGKVIEVNRISPLRPHIEDGQISSWDPLERTGRINKHIFFNQDSLSCGYVPIIGDKIVSEIIESEQNKCSWRALKVLPSNVTNKFNSQKMTNQAKLEESHPGLEISDTSLNFTKLGESKRFAISLTNKSTENFKFLNVAISENPSQVMLLEENPNNEDILPGNTLVLTLCCAPKNMGSSNEFLMLNFTGFTVGKYINITVNPNTSGGVYQRNYSTNYQNAYQDKGQLIRGQRNSTARFQATRLPDYSVPKKVLDVVIKYDGGRDKLGLIEELRVTKKTIFNNLNPMNYEEKFHTLLHMDEISNLINIRQYDQERTCFIQNGEFLMVEIENLAERRPSIVLGDRILARNPMSTSQEQYEGNVFKVGAKHVYLKFSSMFHDIYKGEDYSIKVIPGRSSYRRQHHAVYLVARNLGKDWLFPRKIAEKDPQLNFVYDPYSKTGILNNINKTKENSNLNDTPNGLKKRSSAAELLKKVKEAKLKSEQEKVNGNDEGQSRPNGHINTSIVSEEDSILEENVKHVEKNDNGKTLKLEWYNQNLNCKQRDAVVNILKGVSRPLPYIIFGPPGTGKTVTVIETILQIVRLIPESRILVTAPSNSAADLIALRLVGFGILKPGDLVRLVSVNYAMGENIPAKLVPYCATGSIAREGTSDDNIVGQNGMTYDCSRSVLGRHKITVSTCSSAGTLHMMGFPRGHFTHIFVDEAGQAAEPEVMIPMSFLDKYVGQVVLAGDPMQLGPVILCKIASEFGLNESFLERLTNRFPYVRDIEGLPDTEGFDPRVVTKLLYNYRSLSVILQLFSTLFYNGDLIPTISNTSSAEARMLASLSSILPKTKDERVPSIVFHGVEGDNYQTADSPSWYNPHEAAQIFYYINEFYRLGLKAGNVGVITPYTKQVREIRQLLREAEFSLPKIGTVEDFQGQEFDVILLSTVRSSRDYIPCDLVHGLGFVSSPRRLNVAISRSKVLLVIVGNPALLCNDTYWRSVMNYCVEHGAYTGCHFSS